MSPERIGPTDWRARWRPASLPPAFLGTWGLPDGTGPLVASTATAVAAAIDDAWPVQRMANVEHSWSWRALFDRTRFRGALCVEGDPYVAWACRDPFKMLDGAPYLRVDFIEVHPAHKSSGLGALVLGLGPLVDFCNARAIDN